MNSTRINISIPHNLFAELSRVVEPRKRSRFIAEAIDRYLRERKAKRLASEYEEASAEIHRVNQELEGAVSDGLD
jgi:metal-responsive CopG/Arc/MetJ family transcriptional regulator